MGVFAGYRNREDLNQKVLIKYDGLMCYRTGDFGRLNPKSGQLEFLGRFDHQIKLRGQRIELDEIELVILRSNSYISNCLITEVTNHSNDYLVAYIERNPNYSINESEIRIFCQEHLSSFMVPSFFIILDKFPLLPSGKIDRHRLPKPDFMNISKNNEQLYIQLTSTEQKLCNIFKDALAISSSSLNIEATFTELGATSLNIVKVLGLIRQQQVIGCHPVDLKILFDNPSIRQLAKKFDSLLTTHQTIDKGIYMTIFNLLKNILKSDSDVPNSIFW